MNFLYTSKEMTSVEKLLSLERLTRYTVLSAGDRRAALKHYEHNTRLSEALYTPLQGLEVCLRNSMSLELAALLGANWYDNGHGVFQYPITEMIDRAKRSLIQDGKTINMGRMIAELSFGFWVSVLGPRYDTPLWVGGMRKAFPHRPKGVERADVQKALNAIRRLRNRVAHHEPIVHRKLADDHALILKLISWCCPHTSRWIETQSRFVAVLAGK